MKIKRINEACFTVADIAPGFYFMDEGGDIYLKLLDGEKEYHSWSCLRFGDGGCDCVSISQLMDATPIEIVEMSVKEINYV